MKKIIAMLLALSMVVGWIAMPPAKAHAEDALQNQGEGSAVEANWEDYLVFEMNEDGKSYKVYYCNGKPVGALTIPTTYDGLPVTVIGGEAFADCDEMTSITIPDSITRIVTSAFRNCWGLTSVTMADSVTSIGSGVFADCLKLTDVYYAGTQEQWEAIEIGGNNDPLYNATISFAGEEPVEPEAPWEQYLSFELNPDGESYRVSSCRGIAEGVIRIPATYEGLPVTAIGDSAFRDCWRLTAVLIPNGVTEIGKYAFSGCLDLARLELPDSLVSLDNFALTGCYGIEELRIPASVTNIGEDAFWLGGARSKFLVDENNPAFCSDENGVIFNKDKTVLVAVPRSFGSYTIPAGVTTIAANAFHGCGDLNRVIFSDSVKEIGKYAFGSCYMLMDMDIGGVEVIRDGAFSNSGIENVVLSDSLTTIEYSAFSPSKLRTIHIPASVTEIGYNAFAECNQLTGIWVDAENPNYSSDSFGVLFNKDKTELLAAPGAIESYAIPSGVTQIEDYAFFDCQNLVEVTIPVGVTTIGYDTFGSCDKLADVELPNGVTTIESYAFAYSERLTGITIPNSVTQIAETAFENSLKVVVRCYMNSYPEVYAKEHNLPVVYLDPLEKLSISSLPTKLVYPVGGVLELDGLSLEAVYENGTVMTVTAGYTVSDYDFSTAGTKTITISLNGVSVSFDVVVDADLIAYPESDHPYGNHSDITWEYTHPAPANWLEITFSEETCTESGCDYIYIYDVVGNEYAYTGSALSAATITIPGNAFTIRLITDGSVTEYGFEILSIVAVERDEPTAPTAPFESVVPTDAPVEPTVPTGPIAPTELPVEPSEPEVPWESYLQFELKEDAASYRIVSCAQSATGMLTIPATYNGLPVTEIGGSAFWNCNRLTTVVIPGSVTYISDYAFENCYSLRKVELNEGLISIGAKAFSSCDSLTEIELPDSATDISMGAFSDCNLTAIWVGEKNPAYTNDEFGALFNKDMTVLCQVPCGLGGSYTIPAGVEVIGERAFEGSRFGEIIIPDSVTEIQDYAFQSCSVSSVKIGSGVTRIPDCAFEGCSQLEAIVIPEGVTEIGAYAFESSSLRSIHIPASVTEIGERAFCYCYALENISVDAKNLNYCSDTYGVLFNIDKTRLIQAPSTIGGAYAIPGSVCAINAFAFHECDNLTHITIPDGVRDIWEYTFGQCTNLRGVTIPTSVSYIDARAFDGSFNVTICCYIGSYAVGYAVGKKLPISYLDVVEGLTISALPDKLVYPVGGHLKLNGLVLSVALADGRTELVDTGYEVSDYDFFTAGTKTITVSLGGVSVSFQVVVDAELIELPESDHPYENLSDLTWHYFHPTDAKALAITFSADTETERNWDYIYICDAVGNETVYTGTELAGKTVYVDGNTFTIRLTSDGSETRYGFAIVSVEEMIDESNLVFALNEDGESYNVFGCNKSVAGMLRVPAYYDNKPVTAIGNSAFVGCSGLTAIVLPNSILAIGDSAFAGCDALADVHYDGNWSQWAKIAIGEENEALLNAAMHYVATGCEHVPGEPVKINEWGGGCYGNSYYELVYYCIYCGEEAGRENVSEPAKGHTPGEPVIENANESSCISHGQYQKVTYCTACGEEMLRETVVTEKNGHVPGEAVTSWCREADCTWKGVREWIVSCSVCGQELERGVEELPAKGHKVSRTEIEVACDPTCSRDGYCWKIEYCECGIQLSSVVEVIPATEHIPGDVIQEGFGQASCISDSWHWEVVRCQYCDLMLSCEKVDVKATGHIPGEEYIVNEVPASCTTAGHYEKMIFCGNENCGMLLSKEQVYVPATGHTEEVIPGYAATCTTSGMTDGKRCSTCHQILVEQEDIYPLGHVEEYFPGSAPTCTETGLTDGTICGVCGEHLLGIGTLPATGHTPGEAVIENQTDLGYDLVVYCVSCNEELNRETVASGCRHTEIIEDIVTTPATCVTPGTIVITYFCADCGEVVGGDTDEIPATGKHSFDDIKDTTCNNCDHTRNVDKFEVVGKKIVITEGKSIKKLETLFLFYIGDETAADLYNFQVLQSQGKKYNMFGAGYGAYHGIKKVDAVRLSKEGNYVLFAKYQDMDGKTKYYSEQVSLRNLPIISVDEFKPTVDMRIKENTFQEMFVFYVGQEKPEDLYTFNSLKAIGQQYPEAYGKNGYKSYKYINTFNNTVTVPMEGNYVFLLKYLEPSGTVQYAAELVTVKIVPRMSLNGTKVVVDPRAETNTVTQIQVFYVGDSTVKDMLSFSELKAIGQKYPEAYGTAGYKSFSGASLQYAKVVGVEGDYVVLVKYTDASGATKYVAERLTYTAQ